MARAGRKVGFGRTRDAAALFYALRDAVGYRQAMRDVEALLAVPPRNIERELQRDIVVSPSFSEINALAALSANAAFIRAQLQGGADIRWAKWPERLKLAVQAIRSGD